MSVWRTLAVSLLLNLLDRKDIVLPWYVDLIMCLRNDIPFAFFTCIPEYFDGIIFHNNDILGRIYNIVYALYKILCRKS